MSSSWENAAGYAAVGHTSVWSDRFCLEQLKSLPLPPPPQMDSASAAGRVDYAQDARASAVAQRRFNQTDVMADGAAAAAGENSSLSRLTQQERKEGSKDWFAPLNGEVPEGRELEPEVALFQARRSNEFCLTLQTQMSNIALQDEVKRLSNEVGTLKAEIARLKDRRNHADQSHAEVVQGKEREIATQREEIARLSRDLMQVRDEKQALVDRLRDVELKQQQSSESVASSSQHVKGSSKKSKEQSRITDLERQLKQMRDKNQKLETQLAEIEMEQAAVTVARSNQKKSSVASSQELDHLRAIRNELRTKVGKLREAYSLSITILSSGDLQFMRNSKPNVDSQLNKFEQELNGLVFRLDSKPAK